MVFKQSDSDVDFVSRVVLPSGHSVFPKYSSSTVYVPPGQYEPIGQSVQYASVPKIPRYVPGSQLYESKLYVAIVYSNSSCSDTPNISTVQAPGVSVTILSSANALLVNNPYEADTTNNVAIQKTLKKRQIFSFIYLSFYSKIT